MLCGKAMGLVSVLVGGIVDMELLFVGLDHGDRDGGDQLRDTAVSGGTECVVCRSMQYSFTVQPSESQDSTLGPAGKIDVVCVWCVWC